VWRYLVAFLIYARLRITFISDLSTSAIFFRFRPTQACGFPLFSIYARLRFCQRACGFPLFSIYASLRFCQRALRYSFVFDLRTPALQPTRLRICQRVCETANGFANGFANKPVNELPTSLSMSCCLPACQRACQQACVPPTFRLQRACRSACVLPTSLSVCLSANVSVCLPVCQ
jgi:hypothetical protein